MRPAKHFTPVGEAERMNLEQIRWYERVGERSGSVVEVFGDDVNCTPREVDHRGAHDPNVGMVVAVGAAVRCRARRNKTPEGAGAEDHILRR